MVSCARETAVLHFALTIFLSAFLLFQVQPLIGKIVLPWFGGTPAVWTTCMLFFQVLLLGGYAYAHHSSSRLSPRRQGMVHLGLLVLAVIASAPTILPGEGWKPEGADSPLLVILGLLAVTVGLPYFTLSATGSLVQAWFSRTYPRRSPYALYALSNIGSLLGLLTFPFVVEPRLGSVAQASAWFWGYAAFAALCGALALRVGLRAPAVATVPVPEDSSDAGSSDVPGPTPGLRAVWVGLAACASTMLLAITNQMAIDVASVPFLWVVPLSLYLLSFILCFGSERWYPRVLFYPLLVGAFVGVVGLMLAGAGAKLEVQVLVYSASLFVFVMVCHGELYRLRPHPRHLTAFYLALSLGGALGGVFVGLVAPYVFSQYYELHVCLLATAALVFYAFRRDPRLELRGAWLQRIVQVQVLGFAVIVAYVARLDPYAFRTVIALTAGVAVVLLFALLWSLGRGGRRVWLLPPLAIALLGVNLVIEARRRADDAVEITRDFFGMLRVVDRELGDPLEARRILYHGAINHGFQFLHPDRQMWHNAYFAEESGIGVALTRHPARAAGTPLRIGLLGLGAGTLLTYGRPGDHIRIYEIDPEVEPMSRRHFTYFARTEASTEVVLGDGRLSLEREPDQRYDILILDAFSSDAIPMHLLTREAFDVYMRHLKPDGILAANMSNRHVDIKPVLKQFAQALALEFRWITNVDDDTRGVYGADWGLLTRNAAFLADPRVVNSEDLSGVRTDLRMWTDDYTNIFAVLKWLQR